MAVISGRITLKDVARRAGCSTAVVSTIINQAKGNTLVSEETRERVRRAAKDLGYRPDFASRSLARRRTHTLGIYIPPGPWAGVGFAYEGVILRGIEATALARGYDLLLLNVSGQQDSEVCLRKFGERRIDGLILMHVDPGAPWIGEVLKANQIVVAVDYSGDEPGLDTVGFDNLAAGRVAVEHLYGLGHRRIGYVSSCRKPPSEDAIVRLAGYRQSMAEHGLEVDRQWIFDASMLAKPLLPDDPVCQLEAKFAAEHIIRLGPSGPTAWVFYGDLVAVHAMRHLQAAGIQLPGQLSLVGVDDSEWSRFVSPQLTSVRHPLEEMGRRAADMLITKSERATDADAVSGQMPAAERVLFPPLVVARESSVKWPGDGRL